MCCRSLATTLTLQVSMHVSWKDTAGHQQDTVISLVDRLQAESLLSGSEPSVSKCGLCWKLAYLYHAPRELRHKIVHPWRTASILHCIIRIQLADRKALPCEWPVAETR